MGDLSGQRHTRTAISASIIHQLICEEKIYSYFVFPCIFIFIHKYIYIYVCAWSFFHSIYISVLDNHANSSTNKILIAMKSFSLIISSGFMI